MSSAIVVHNLSLGPPFLIAPVASPQSAHSSCSVRPTALCGQLRTSIIALTKRASKTSLHARAIRSSK